MARVKIRALAVLCELAGRVSHAADVIRDIADQAEEWAARGKRTGQ